MGVYDEISQAVQQGRVKNVKEFVAAQLEAGNSPKEILDDGLLVAMSVLGEKFKNNEIYVPEVLMAARAMSAGVEVLKPFMTKADRQTRGKAVLGTVKGDLHDIGKNLVKIMFEGKGIEVVDLGVDVPADKFVQTAIDESAQIIACSALLTTTMSVMKDVVAAADNLGVRDQLKIMVGGAPVTQDFCDSIGADCYAPDAASASDAALSLCTQG